MMQSLACLIRYMSFIKRQLNCAENNSRGLTAPGGKTHCARTFRGLLAPDYFDIRILELERPVSSPRCGFTLVEFIVAMVVLGVALAGMFPLLIVQSRTLESLELRYTEKGSEINQGKSWFSPVHRPYLGDNRIPRGERENYGVWYLIPAEYDLPPNYGQNVKARDAWARKLGAAATLTREMFSTPDEPKLVLDDEDDADNDDYVEESGGEWRALVNDEGEDEGYDGDARLHDAADSQPTAVWTFRIADCKIPPGYYHVYATWPTLDPDPGELNASFIINENVGNEVRVNQHELQNILTFDNLSWQRLTTVAPIRVDIQTTDVKVRISAIEKEGVNEYYPVVADAVLLVPVNNEVLVQSVTRSISTPEETTATVSVTVVEH